MGFFSTFQTSDRAYLSLFFSIDDIEDNSKLRRGIPVAHSIYGVAQTINSANYIYFLALERITAMGHPRGVAIFTSRWRERGREGGREREREGGRGRGERGGRKERESSSVRVSSLSPEQLLALHRGQGKDIYWRDSYICPTEEEYIEMVQQSR